LTRSFESYKIFAEVSSLNFPELPKFHAEMMQCCAEIYILWRKCRFAEFSFLRTV